jgi:two-component system OmpR family sensor kinase/two-component system sensor histidine kinase BaeS
MKQLRLFWLMVIAFFLAITLAVCGMVSFVGLTFAGTFPSGSFRDGLRESADSYAAILSDYYVANGDSWQGVEQRIDAPPFGGSSSFFAFTILDPQGDLLVGNTVPMPPMQSEPGRHTRPSLPIERASIRAHGREVAVLVVRPDFEPQFMNSSAQPTMQRAPSFLWGIWRSFLIAGFVIGGLLLALAVMFARRLTRPLRNLTAASEALAAGNLAVRVPGATIRELDELSGAFNRMAGALATADTQRRQMTADIAHELRTPLSIIRGRLEGVQDGVYEPSPEQVVGLLNETALLERLVEDLRLLALAEAGQLPLYREPTDPRELVTGVVAAFTDQATRQGVVLQIEAADDLPEIDVDPQRIAQVLTNLVSNALRYTPDGGTIVLSIAQIDQTPSPKASSPSAKQSAGSRSLDTTVHTASAVLFTILDTGPGIPVEDLPKVFDRFWRSDRSRTRGSGGAGLGLAIVRQIVEAHDGSVSVVSEPGQGAQFRVLLPVTSSDKAREAALRLNEQSLHLLANELRR